MNDLALVEPGVDREGGAAPLRRGDGQCLHREEVCPSTNFCYREGPDQTVLCFEWPLWAEFDCATLNRGPKPADAFRSTGLVPGA